MKQIRCALYPRVSTEEQALNGLSLATQIDDLTTFANRMGYHIVGVYADEGVSARKPTSKRPALLKLLKDVQENKIDLILVTKLDRWFRNIKEYHITQEILEKHNCYWKTVFENYDTSTANGQMVVNIMLSVNQSECDRDSERIKTVLDYKFRQGEHVTGAAPYGYMLQDKKQVKDPDTEPIVEDAISHYFACFSKRKTVEYITLKYTDHPKKPSIYQINRILSEETYAGIYRGIQDYHPAYLTMDQYRLIRSTADSKTYPQTHEPYIFSGLLICPECGAVLTGFRKKNIYKDGTVIYYKRYKCSRKYASHRTPCITERVVEEYMLEHVCSELSAVICTTQKKKDSGSVSKAPVIRAEMDRLNILFQKGRITDEYYDKQYVLLEEALKNEQEDTSELKLEHYTKLKKHFSGNWKELYDMLDSAHKNAFWKRTIKEIRFDNETHKISGFSFV